MSLFNVLDTAASGMSAQSVRMNVTSSNLANADTVSSSVERTYRARHPVFQAVAEGLAFGPDAGARRGVAVQGIVESAGPLRAEYRPEHPLADEGGYIYRPNVNVIEEMANLISASRSYQTNVEVVNASKQMLLRTISLGR
jgi:flagellar basal-body rod protein FlgC